jgi:pyruvate dehydrogenase E1 component alpha subunit
LLSKAFEGSVDYLQILDESGKIDPSLVPADVDDPKLLEMLKWMLFARAADAKALSLQRQGIAVTYAPLVGQEATQIGAALAMRKQDIFVPNFRQHGVLLARGMPLYNFYLSTRGFEDANKLPGPPNSTCFCVPVASQIPHAAGIAFALKYLGKDAVAVAFVGDGGTSEGDFYEGLNLAGVWKAPLVAVIENNQWAISVPRSKQTAAQTLAQKGFAAGLRCVQVDGNDVIAVYKAVKEAIASANDGPTVVECVTYRMSMHTTADDPTKYRSDEEVAVWAKKDPIDRLRKYLAAKSLWTEEAETKLAEENLRKIDEAVELAAQFKPDPKSMFENVYSFMPDVLKEEMDEAAASGFWQ